MYSLQCLWPLIGQSKKHKRWRKNNTTSHIHSSDYRDLFLVSLVRKMRFLPAFSCLPHCCAGPLLGLPSSRPWEKQRKSGHFPHSLLAVALCLVLSPEKQNRWGFGCRCSLHCSATWTITCSALGEERGKDKAKPLSYNCFFKCWLSSLLCLPVRISQCSQVVVSYFVPSFSCD